MESAGQRFSVISRTSNFETENRAPLTPYQPISVIKNPSRPWVKPVRRSKHPKHIIVLEGEPVTYKCTVCSTTFKSKSNCCYHKHCGDEGEKPFTCPICDRKFSTKTHFSYHTLMHSGVNPHKCSVCEKSFKTKYKLRRHEQVHTDTQKKFFCDVCGRAFLRKSSIHVHKQVHTGVKPYQCNECPKAFREKKNLIFHLSHHTGIKNWVCEICGRSYVLKRDLELHKRTHSRIRPFPCPVSKCQQTFSQRRYLKRHMETHENCVKFICNLCEKEFSRKDNLQRHIVNTHLESQNSNSSKAEKTKHILLDTAPYIKTIKVRDAVEKSDAAVLVEPSNSVLRTESVIMSTSRTDDVDGGCSQREGNSCNRISVIRSLADISSETGQEAITDEPREYHRLNQVEYGAASSREENFPCDEGVLKIDADRSVHTFHANVNRERNSDVTRSNSFTVEPFPIERDTMYFDSRLQLHGSEPSHSEENDPRLVQNVHSRYDVRDEVSLQYVELESSKRVSSFYDESVEYSVLPTPLEPTNSFTDRRANEDQLSRPYPYAERISAQVMSSEKGITLDNDDNDCLQVNERIDLANGGCSSQKNSSVGVEQNENLYALHDGFNSYDPSFEERTHRAVSNFETHDQHFATYRQSESALDGRPSGLIYHNLTNCLSTGPSVSSQFDSNHECASSDGNSNVARSYATDDEAKEIASHFVPHFAPERTTSDSVKVRCMLPKKVIAASYRDCIAHETIHTRAGGLDSTIKDNYKLLDLSMKSQ